jgi:hypothetical protein
MQPPGRRFGAPNKHKGARAGALNMNNNGALLQWTD